MYKEFISKKEFNGTSGKLIEEIIKAFINEEIVKSKLGEFYNIAGIIEIEDYEDITFNIGIDGVELNVDEVLEEEVIKNIIMRHFLHLVEYKYRELDIDSRAEAITTLLNSNIKGTYTLLYS